MALTASKAIQELHSELKIEWVIPSGNARLASALEDARIPWLGADLYPTSTLFRNPLRVSRKILRVWELFRKINPESILVVQGTITDALDGIAAARIAGIPLASYLPMAHRWKELGLGRRGTAARSALMSLLYLLIPRYITIDEQQAIRIRQQAPRAEIRIVENYTPALPPHAIDKSTVRRRLNIASGQIVIGVVARIDFAHKGQDWLIRTLQENEFMAGKLLLFVGDGADRSQLEELIAISPAKDQMRILGWCDNTDEIYAALDVLLLPSRMEGVPLAMLEALSRRIPVVATDRDGMKSWLPNIWRFPFQDGPAMLAALDEALYGEHAQAWQEVDAHLAHANSSARFAGEFYEALTRISQ